MPRGNGGIIGPVNTSFSGVWSLTEAQLRRSANTWPNFYAALLSESATGTDAVVSASASAADQYYEYTTLLLPGNGTNGAQNNTFLDGSTNNFTITRNGNTTQGTFSPFSQTGWGNYFNGSSTLDTSNAAFNPAGAFTIEFWFYGTDSATATQGLVSTWASGLSPAQGILIWKTGANCEIQIGNASTGGTTIATFTWATYLNQWNHFALVRNSSNSCAVFLNGTRLAAPVTKSGSPGQTALTIGRAFPNSASSYFTGYMSNVSFVSGSNVYDPASSTITVPTTPLSTSTTNQALLTCQANRFIDSNTATTAKTITLTGSPSVQAFSPFNPTASWSAATNGGSGYFDGSGDYLAAGSNAAWAMSTGDFSIEFWTYPTVLGVDGGYVSADYTTGFHVAQASGTLYFWVANSQINATSALSVNQWQHVVCTRASGTSRIFVNGVLKQTGANTNSVAQNSLYIGTSSHALTEEITGYLANVRVVKGQIPTTYATSSTTIGAQIFTPPTSPLTTSSQGVTASNTSLLLNFTNAGIYDATSKNDLETVGSAQISTTTSQFGGSSIYLNGTNSWLIAPFNTVNDIGGTAPFTIEFWSYFNSLAAIATVVGKTNNSTASGSQFEFTVQTNGQISVTFYYSNSAFTVTSAVGAITTGSWQYVAMTKDSSGNYKIFINGTQSGTTVTNTSTLNTPTLATTIGAQITTGNRLCNAYFQDFRITRGVARTITASPTAAFPTL
jgi:hypothetical protein